MQAYIKKYQSVASNIGSKKIIAKPPTNIPSLETPNNINASIVKGYIKNNNVGYQISAFNEYGETVASDELSLTIGSSLECVSPLSYNYTPGILEIGHYYYGITATNEYGETNILQTIYTKNSGTPAPKWSNENHIINSNGLLPRGRYFYSVSCIVGNKETDISTEREVLIENNNSIVTIYFKSVEGASSYNIYRRSSIEGLNSQISKPKKIGNVEAPVYSGDDQNVSFTDNGSSIGTDDAPSFNNTTAGIEISWIPLKNVKVKSYKIYGRTSPNSEDLRFIAEVPSNQTSYKDQGYLIPSYKSPISNTTGYSDGAGVLLKWNMIVGASGYKIYGRTSSKDSSTVDKKGLIATISDPKITSWVDTGLLTPNYQFNPPVSDTTDGTTGILGSVIPDGNTLEISPSGILSVKGGIDSFLGNSIIRNISDNHILVYNNEIQKWNNIDFKDLIFTILTMSDGTVVPIDEKFNDFKDKLVETLSLLTSINEQFISVNEKINNLSDRIDNINKKIGTSFKELEKGK